MPIVCSCSANSCPKMRSRKRIATPFSVRTIRAFRHAPSLEYQKFLFVHCLVCVLLSQVIANHQIDPRSGRYSEIAVQKDEIDGNCTNPGETELRGRARGAADGCAVPTHFSLVGSGAERLASPTFPVTALSGVRAISFSL